MKRNLSLIFFLTILGSGVSSQNCNLSEDSRDAYGNILRSQEWLHGDGGSVLSLWLQRSGSNYSIILSLSQPFNESGAVSFNLDAEAHPVIFMLNNGGQVKCWLKKDGNYASKTEDGEIVFSEEYTISERSMESFGQSQVTAIVFRCNGRYVNTGGAANEIRFALNGTQGGELTNILRCLAKEDRTTSMRGASASPKKSAAPTTTKSNKTDKLLKELISAVQDGSDKVKQSVDQSGTSQMEQNFRLEEKLEQLAVAVEKLNNKKDEPVKKFVPRVFGFGAYFKTNFLFSDIVVQLNNDMDLTIAKVLAGTSINMTFNAGMKKKVGFRFEPNVDFLVSTAKTGSGTQTIRNSTNLVEAGLKLLIVVRRGRVNIYPGVSGSYVNMQAKQTVGSNTTSSLERNGGSVGLILGGEYLLTPYIGVRLESGFLYYILGKAKGGAQDTYNSFGSFARIGGSFYF